GREKAGAGADFRQAMRADLRPSWQTRSDRDLNRIDRNLDVAFRSSTRGDVARGDRSVRGDSGGGGLAASTWLDRQPDRADHWADWGNHVKDHWHGDRYHSH